ncbi:UDP-N-acetylmuramate--L-alanine ligase [Bartonella sp. TP]|uniref:UDP-N-acetylmuramate--L-alanine ligase n=1 Tax=Bartonella sp. TP TaxID=3057550 RepID=UPI0025B1B076|nr:UDP-N-acetylmuramate--L-alanine ligase [Bartonella sp. TP]MDN5249080.1 UDP-N-acetylmuramate--L-alanine ligase [Alphaproteobacteria bacterium]WJW79764.1 UDP-N-acetylmuramate--L-alanine ligase [Bartonella sp. TP]
MKMPINIGIIHFIGIGGIGMSGIAEILHNLNYKVQGSDQKDNANVHRLLQKNIPVFIGHKIDNIKQADVVVVSSAVPLDNVEYIYAKEKGLPIVKRAEMLAELMRFRRTIAVGGTHGKTTTTSLVSALLSAGGADPTIINGGIINEYGSNAILGSGDWMVVEADESDGSFLKLPADIAIVTNIDPEHLDHYGSFEDLKKAFRSFIENIPFYGFAVLCLDHPQVAALSQTIHNKRIITYGHNSEADVCFLPKGNQVGFSSTHKLQMSFDIVIRNKKTKLLSKIENLVLPMLGIHNISNATAAIAVALELGISVEAIKKGLANFSGVKRRFTYIGSWQDIEVFDDYGHHPKEIQAVLSAARQSSQGRIIAVVQPHRYTRLQDLFNEFAQCLDQADIVVLMPVYSAGEPPIENINSKELSKHIKKPCYLVDTQAQLVSLVAEIAKPHDYVVFLGAGDITNWAATMPAKLAERSNAS